VAQLKDGSITAYEITPEQVGLARAKLADIQGGADSAASAALMKEVLGGAPGARRDMVLLNSGAALMAAGAADDLEAGIALAADCIDSGRALATLERLISFTQETGTKT
jgi:anthranilate phosphoribosyltransferase